MRSSTGSASAGNWWSTGAIMEAPGYISQDVERVPDRSDTLADARAAPMADKRVVFLLIAPFFMPMHSAAGVAAQGPAPTDFLVEIEPARSTFFTGALSVRRPAATECTSRCRAATTRLRAATRESGTNAPCPTRPPSKSKADGAGLALKWVPATRRCRRRRSLVETAYVPRLPLPAHDDIAGSSLVTSPGPSCVHSGTTPVGDATLTRRLGITLTGSRSTTVGTVNSSLVQVAAQLAPERVRLAHRDVRLGALLNTLRTQLQKDSSERGSGVPPWPVVVYGSVATCTSVTNCCSCSQCSWPP